MFKARRLQRDLHIDHVREGGELGAMHTHTTGTVTILANDTAISVLSRKLFVVRRSQSGWHITDYMFNRPRQMKSAAQANGRWVPD